MGNMVNVVFRTPHPDYGYFAGQSGKIDAVKAQKLLQEGYIIIAPEKEDSGIPPTDPLEVINPLPPDFPARIILFEAGFDTIDKVLQAGESLTDIKGIGKGTIRQIDNWCKKHN